MTVPVREVRAVYDDTTITVYQAYRPEIADAALTAGTFVAPFSRDRMTWVKPSFLWMMYRCGWATRPGQERVLAVRMTRAGFAWALARACLSHFEPDTYADVAAWEAAKRESPVRVQWDPERSMTLDPLPYRAIQVGLSGEAVHRYVDEWITGVEDVTDLANTIGAAPVEARAPLLPVERPYPLPPGLARRVGAAQGIRSTSVAPAR